MDDSPTEDLIFQKLDEFVKDEGRIITSSFVAGELNISIQQTRTVLHKYVKDHKGLRVTYFLAGVLEDGDPALLLVKDEDLEKERACLKEITSEVVHSIQQDGDIDFQAISLVDFGQVRDKPLLGSVVGKNCVKRKIKAKQLPAVPIHNPVVKKNSLKSFFPDNGEKSNKKQEKQEKSMTKTQTAKNNPMLNFLKGSQNGVKENPKKIQKEESEEKLKNRVEEVVEMDVDVKESPEKEKENTKKRTRPNQNKNTPVTKRRKRIQEICDSDSSDIFEEDKESEDVIEPSYDEEQAPPPKILAKPLAPKNKKRKAVQRTFKDEEGYLVTITEYVFESDSEEEAVPVKKEAFPVKKEEIPVKKEEKPKFQKKSSTDSENDSGKKGRGKKGNKKPVMGKQQSITSFFSKK